MHESHNSRTDVLLSRNVDDFRVIEIVIGGKRRLYGGCGASFPQRLSVVTEPTVRRKYNKDVFRDRTNDGGRHVLAGESVKGYKKDCGETGSSRGRTGGTNDRENRGFCQNGM